jgi:hypothetical protein
VSIIVTGLSFSVGFTNATVGFSFILPKLLSLRLWTMFFA